MKSKWLNILVLLTLVLGAFPIQVNAMPSQPSRERRDNLPDASQHKLVGDGTPNPGDATDPDSANEAYRAHLAEGFGVLNGILLDAATSMPVSGASIVAQGTLITNSATTQTDGDGYYRIELLNDTLTVTASTYGYLPAQIAGIQVIENITITQNIALTPADWHTVSGVIYDADTGWPLYARIEIDGYPGEPIWNDPLDGTYSISLPEGMPFTFHTSAFVEGYTPAAVVLGPLNNDEVVSIELNADPAACNAPGYSAANATTLLTEGFESPTFPPDGWIRYNLDGTVNQWERNIARPYQGGASASHLYSTAGVQDGWLVTPPLTASTEGTIELSFWEYAAEPYYYVRHSIWACTGDCATPPTNWTLVAEFGDPVAAWRQQTVTMEIYSGQTVSIAFRYEGNNADNWYIDDIVADAFICTPPAAGGLVMGNIYDDESGMPLVGAKVEHETSTTSSRATPADPAVADGFYTIFAPAGAQVLTATMNLYQPDIKTTTVIHADTVRQDFHLLLRELAVAPALLHTTLEIGSSKTLTLTLENRDSGLISWEIDEMSPGQSPLSLSIPTKTNQSVESIYALAGVPAYGIDLYDHNFIYFPDSNLPGTWEVVKAAFGSGKYFAGDFAGEDFSQLYVIDNVAKQLLRVDTATGNTTVIGPCQPLLDQIWSGMSWDASTGTMYASAAASSAQMATLFSINLATGAATPLKTITGALGIIDIAVNGDGEMYGIDIYSDVLVHINKASGAATVIGALGIDAVYAQGMDFDDSSGVLYWAAYATQGELRVIDTMTGASTLVGAFPGGAEIDAFALATGIPWLRETPTAGELNTWERQIVDVTFDASTPATAKPGDYQATLHIINDAPNGSLLVPVTMTVTAPPTYAKMDGIISSLGHCDERPLPIHGAEIVITSNRATYNLTSDANGYYELWLDAAEGPLGISVTATEHTIGAAQGVIVTATQTTTQNFNLRRVESCVKAAPANLQVNIPAGMTTSAVITLNNTGVTPTNFKIFERDNDRTETALMMAGNDILIVNEEDKEAGATAVEASLAELGYTYQRVSNTTFTAMHLSEVLMYQAVIYLGVPNSGVEQNQCIAYMDAGGNFMVADDDIGYSLKDTSFYRDYLQSNYVSDAGSNGVIVGMDIMAGISIDISTAIAIDYPDDFTAGAEGVGLFGAPSGNLAGIRIARMDYKAIYLSWDPEYGLAAERTAIMAAAFGYLIAPDIPWISETPVTGPIAADSTQTINVTFDTITYTPGTYTSMLQIKTDDPSNDSINIPVTMTVVAPTNGVELTPATAALDGVPGKTVTYTLHLTNTGNVANTFTISNTAATWGVSIPAASITLNAGEGADFTVTVSIPEAAADGDDDAVTITVSGAGDANASSLLTTTAIVAEPEGHKIYLPLIFR